MRDTSASWKKSDINGLESRLYCIPLEKVKFMSRDNCFLYHTHILQADFGFLLTNDKPRIALNYLKRHFTLILVRNTIK